MVKPLPLKTQPSGLTNNMAKHRVSGLEKNPEVQTKATDKRATICVLPEEEETAQ